jgi:hypothetical protein
MFVTMRSYFLCAILLAICTGCRTTPLPPVNLAEPGWKLLQGQAVWKASKSAPELAGELQLATGANGRSFVQFTKTPLPIVVGQTTSTNWQIQFVPQNRSFSAPGKPSSRLIWLHLASCLSGQPAPKGWTFEKRDGGAWRFENKGSGEVLEGWLAP